MSQLRCAIYARYSTDKQNPLSIDDQIRKCREFAARNGWEDLDAHIYADEAICGATDDRIWLEEPSRSGYLSGSLIGCNPGG